MFPLLARICRALEALAYYLVRVLAGLFLALHGAQKLLGWFGGNPSAETAAFAALGFEPAHVFMMLNGYVELSTGLALIMGFFTRPAAVVAAIVLAAAAVALRAKGFDCTQGGFEYATLWAAACVLVAARGGGEWSVDHAIGIEI